MIKPPRLHPGDTIAFLAPAGPLAALTPHRLEGAQKWFEQRGYQIKLPPTARMNEGLHSSASPQQVDVGHTDFITTVPLGVTTRLDSGNNHWKLPERPTS